MALHMDFETDLGTAAYHRIEAGKIVYQREPEVIGAIGSVYVTLKSYRDAEARQAGVSALSSRTIRIRFGNEVSQEFLAKGVPTEPTPVIEEYFDPRLGKKVQVVVGEKEPPVPPRLPVIRSDEPVRAHIYSAIKSMPEFAGAIDL